MHLLEIHIQRPCDQGIPIVVTLHRTNDYALQESAYIQLDETELNCLIETPRVYGRNLGQAVFSSSPESVFKEALGGAGGSGVMSCSLVLEEDDFLNRLRWEWLQAPFEGGWDFLATDRRVEFSQYLRSNTRITYPAVSRTGARAVVMVAPPGSGGGGEPFDTGRVINDLCEALEAFSVSVLAPAEEMPQRWRSSWKGPPTLTTLETVVAKETPAVLHIFAHGKYSERKKTGALFLQKNDGSNDRVETDRIWRALQVERPPRLVFLASCHSGSHQAGGAGSHAGIGHTLVRKLGIPAVIAMRDRLEISLALALAKPFYGYLADNSGVAHALGCALADIEDQGLIEDLLVPVTYSRLRGKPLFDESLDRPLTPEEELRGLRKMIDLIHQRAPCLEDFLDEAQTACNQLSAGNMEALPSNVRQRFDSFRVERDTICERVLEIRFQWLALGGEPPDCPIRHDFPGMNPIRKGFFPGRHHLIDRASDLMAECRLLLVTGPAGSGKTSLIRSGLPSIRHDIPFHFFDLTIEPIPQPDQLKSEDRGWVVLDGLDAEIEKGIPPELSPWLEPEISLPVILICHDRHKNLLIRDHGRHLEVPAMDNSGLVTALETRARVSGYIMEQGLPELLASDLHQCCRSMSWGQALLVCLWERRHGRYFLASEYVAMGGLGSLVNDALEQCRARPEYRPLVDNICLRLANAETKSICSEHVIPAGVFAESAHLLLPEMVKKSLLALEVNQGRTRVKPAHPEIINNYLAEPGDNDANRRIVHDALVWESGGFENQDLRNRDGWAAGSDHLLPNALENRFLEAARTYHHKVEKKRRLMNRALSSLLVVTLLALCFSFLAFRRASRNYVRAEMQFARSHALLAREANDRGEYRDALDFTRKAMTALESLPGKRRVLELEAQTYRALTATPQFEILAGDSPVEHLFFSPNGVVLVVVHEKGVLIRNLSRGTSSENIPLNHAVGVAVTDQHVKRLAIGGIDGSLSLIDLEKGKTLFSAKEHDLAISGLVFLPDNHELVSAGKDGRMFRWRDDGQFLLIYDDLSLLGLSYDQTAGLRTVANDETGHLVLLQQVEETFEPVHRSRGSSRASVLLSQNGHMVMLTPPGKFLIWHQDQVKTLEEESRLMSFAFHDNGHLLGASSRESLIAWDIPRGTLKFRRPVGNNFGEKMVFDSSGRRMALVDDRGIVRLSDCRSGMELAVLKDLKHSINHIAFSPDGNSLAIGFDDGSVGLWNIQRESHFVTFAKMDEYPQPVGMDHSGSRLISTSSDATTMWDITNDREMLRLDSETDWVSASAFSSDGTRWLAGREDGSAVVYDARTGSELGTLRPPESKESPLQTIGSFGNGMDRRVADLTVSEDGARAVLCGRDGIVSVYALSDFSPKGVFRQPFAATTVVAAGSKILVGFAHESAFLLDSSGARLSTLEGHGAGLTQVAAAPRGEAWASAAGDGTLGIWGPNGKNRALIKLADEISCLHFAISGKLLLVATIAGEIHSFSVEDGQPGAVMRGHTGAIHSMISRDNLLLTTSEDGSARLWDLELQGCFAILEGHNQSLGPAAFPRVGKTIWTTGMDGLVRSWPIDINPNFRGGQK